MVLALATSDKIWLAVFAGVFIAFALVSSFVLSRRNPDFPGEEGRTWFIVATIGLFVAMMFAVAVFAQESEEAHGEEVTETAPGGEPQPQETATTETATTETATTETETTPEGGGGDPQAGRAVFLSQGCGGCHAFSAAGTNAAIGPNLDESLQGDDAEHIQESILDPAAEVESGFQPIMPTDYQDKLSPKQVDDVVAFLSQ